MTGALALRTYLAMNFLLVVSMLLFRVARVFVSRKSRPDHRGWIRIGQLLILLSILSPALMMALPRPAPVEPSGNPFPEETLSPARQSAAHNPRALRYRVTVPLRLIHRSAHWIESDGGSWVVRGMELLLALGWLGFGFRLGLGRARLRALLARTTPIRSQGRVRVVFSDAIAVPFSARARGLRWVAVSGAVFSRGKDYRLAVRHELEHHRQGHTSWALVIEGLRVFFFPNPAIYAWKRELAELQEFSCDQAVIGRRGVSRHEYGSCLVRVAEAALGSRSMHVGTTCMAAVSGNPMGLKSQLRRRIEMFSQDEKRRARRSWSVALGTLAAVSTVALAYGADRSLREAVLANPGEVQVDPEIQKIADGILSRAVQAEGARSGFAIVAEPATGRILAVANLDTTGKRSGYWSLSEVFEPASVVKSLVAAEALERGLTTPGARQSCENGNYRYGDRVYHDWKQTGWDSLSTAETIADSSDICTMKLAEKIGADGLLSMLKDFGFGPDGSAKEFPQARDGQLPPPDADPEQLRVVPFVSMGAGFGITPIEMLQAYGAIANGGQLMAPMSANTPESGAQVVRRVISEATAETMRGILAGVVRSGTGKPARSALYTTAGKTATSHYPRMVPYDRNDGDFAGFIGFAPVHDPRVTIYVGIRDPESDDGAHGGRHAAPVFRQLAEEVLKFMKVAPDQP